MAHGTPETRCDGTAYDEVECTLAFGQHPETSRALIDAWKAQIPYSRRTYEPKTRVWRFWGGYQAIATALLLQYFPDARVPPRWQSPPTPPRVGTDSFAVLHLLPSAPLELIDAAFRCLAKRHHPDVGGDTATMRRLTEAHDALSRRLSA